MDCDWASFCAGNFSQMEFITLGAFNDVAVSGADSREPFPTSSLESAITITLGAQQLSSVYVESERRARQLSGFMRIRKCIECVRIIAHALDNARAQRILMTLVSILSSCTCPRIQREAAGALRSLTEQVHPEMLSSCKDDVTAVLSGTRPLCADFWGSLGDL